MSSESYLIVGGCGFLGRYIVEQLLARGEAQVSVFDIVQRHFDSNVTFYIGDISKAEDVANAISKSGATAVIHTASPNHNLGRQIYHTVNVLGTRIVVDACISHGVKKLVYTSTASATYDGVYDMVTADERLSYPEKALDAYNETKVAAEKMVLAANGEKGLLTCALRPAGIFGEGDRQMIIGFYNVVKNGQTKWQIGDNTCLNDFTYVANVAHAHLLAVDKLGTSYPNVNFRDSLSSIDKSMGGHRVPTSDARPLGPNPSPTESDQLADSRFQSGEIDPSDLRPVLRNRMDPFQAEANDDNETSTPIAGQAFFITNGEPVYFWDFARTIWRQLGHVPPAPWVIPGGLGYVISLISEWVSKFTGKEPGFTRFRVAVVTQHRYYDIEKARRLLGYEPLVSLDQGIRKWTQWYKGELIKQIQAGETEKTK